MELHYLIPFSSAFVYALAALCLKRSTNQGVGPWRTTFFSNLVQAILIGPLWFSSGGLEWGMLYAPIAASGAFFLGQTFTCLAIHKGDVSVVTPLMGTKAVFVACLAVWLTDDFMSASVWLAACLAAVAILLLRGEGRLERTRLLPSIAFGLAASISFAFFDILFQRFSEQIEFAALVTTTFFFSWIWSFLLIPFFKTPVGRISRKTWSWLGIGSFLLAAQAAGQAAFLSFFGQAAVLNVLYSSRGIWSVVLVWLIGKWFGNQEGKLGKAELLRRLLGAALLCCAIFLVV